MSTSITYSKYKASGSQWLPCIPAHWDMLKISHMANLKSGENITSESIDSVGEYLVYGGNGIRGYFHDYTHDGSFVLIGRQGALCGNINYATGKFWASEHAIVVTPDREVNTHWLGETLRVMNLGKLSTAAAQPGISVEVVKQQKLPFPPLDEQNKISAFILWKSKAIDRLIAKKKLVISELIDYRSSLISQLTQNGLSKGCLKKDSSIEWLGFIPKHWRVIRFRHAFSFGRGLGITKSNLKDEGISCINYGEIHSKFGFEVIPEKHELKCVDKSYLESSKGSLLGNGDFVFADTSEDIEGSGNFTYINGNTPVFAGYHTVITRPITSDVPRYLAYLLDSTLFRYQIRKSVTGVKVYSITQAILKGAYLWLPPKEEQEDIVKFLDEKLKKIDSSISKNKNAINKLTEYRFAVTSAAITGQIDVQNIEIPEEN